MPVAGEGGSAGACAGDGCTGPCRPTVFEGSGSDCVEPVWAWDGDGCAETAHCACASGECERVYPTALECLTGNAECMGPEPAPDPSCAPTTFESTDGDCVETSYVWNGNQCVSVVHCGCAAGDCGRLYADYQNCESAHAACLPEGCGIQDARSGGLMCGTTFGFAFNGWMCEEVICNCSGADCAEVQGVTLEQCESTWQLCLDRVPECQTRRFPTASTEIGVDATYPEFAFAVQGYPDLYDPQTKTVAVFADWTTAAWGGWEDLPVEDTFCAPIPGEFIPFPSTFSCPAPKQLKLSVGNQTFHVQVTAHWPQVATLAAPTNVEVRIAAHPSGTLVLQIREAVTDQPVVMVVQSLADAPSVATPWEFAPFTFTEGAELCRTAPGACGWSFSPMGLVVSTEGMEDVVVEPLNYRPVEARGVTYNVFHWGIFERVDQSENACSSPYTPRQSFVVLARAPVAP